jgi:hypothetical protein
MGSSSVAASNLSASGDTSLFGNLNVGGNVTAGSISFAAASSTGVIAHNATTTNLVATNATSTNLFASLANFTTGIFNSLTASIANITGLTVANSTTTNATTTNLAVLGTSYFAGNVGIGTTSPYLSLSVGGSGIFGGNVTAATFTATSTTATSTFAGPLSTPNPIDVYDNFSGPAGAALSGRLPVIGQHAWSSSGTGYLNAFAGAGVLATIGGNTYFIIQSSQTPFEIYTTFEASGTSTPGATISVVKNEPTQGFSVMWHTNYNAGGDGLIEALYWNAPWNGATTTVSGYGPTYGYQAQPCPTLISNTPYVAHEVLNPPYFDADIETPTGTVLCSMRTYEPLLATLIGPYVYVQSGSLQNVYT